VRISLLYIYELNACNQVKTEEVAGSDDRCRIAVRIHDPAIKRRRFPDFLNYPTDSSLFLQMATSENKPYSVFRQIPERPEIVTFGGSYQEVLPDQLKSLNVSRVFLVVSKSLAESSSEVEALQSLPGLKEKLVGTKIGVRPHGYVFSCIQPNRSDIDDVVEIINRVRDLSVDCLVTVGAGSISDACKNVKFGLSNNVHTKADFLPLKAKIDFDSGSINLPDIPLHPPTLKLICIPTSLSAGEYNCKSGGLDRETGKKFPFFQPDCMPDVILCDPYLARKTPEWVWLSTGVRSLDHAMETLCNPNFNLKDPVLADAYRSSKESVDLLMRGLILSKEDPENVEARDMCQRGSWKASLAVVREVPMGGSHAIGHILGPVGNVPHGVTSCVMCPAVLRYNYRVNSKQQDEIKEMLIRNGIVKELGLQDKPDLQLWQILATFIRYIGMPQSLKEVGIEQKDYKKISEETLGDFWSRTNPIPLERSDQVMEILEMAA